MSVGIFEGGVGQDRWQIGLKLFYRHLRQAGMDWGYGSAGFRDTQMIHVT